MRAVRGLSGQLSAPAVAVAITLCSALLSALAIWLLGLVGSRPHQLVQILIMVAIPLILAAVWLRSGASSRRDVDGEASTESIERERDQLHAAVNNLPIGLVMFDADKRVLIVNDSYRQMYDLSRAVTARGRHLRDMLEERLATDNIEGADRAGYIERILKLVEQKDSSTRLVELSDGRTFNILHHPVAGGGWIGTHEDVTEREKLNSQLASQNELLRERELQLEAQNLKFNAALKNMSQGLCMFDPEHRLVLCNEQYLDMYRLAPQDATPGMPLQELLRRRMARGTYPKGPLPDDYMAELVRSLNEKSEWKKVTELPDGRFIALQNRLMSDGGWLATHEDVTELRRAELELVAARAAAETAAQDAQTAHGTLLEAFEVVPEGLVVFDEHDRYKLWNRRYLELYADRADLITANCRFEDFLRAGLASSQYPEAKGREEKWLADRLARHALAENSHDQRSPNGRWIRIQERRTASGGSIGVRFDITHLKQREEALRAQNMRFDMALNNMSHGLCMFDREQRLVVCNEQYAQLYDLPAELTQPGTTLQAIVKHRVASGLYRNAEQVEDVFSAVANNSAAIRICELSDGRAILVKHQPMPDGGYVATHEDITEQRNIEARIQHMAHHDALTDLPNRLLLHERLEQALDERALHGPIAVIWLDLDRFKDVNDTLGHSTGDALLKSVAERLQSCVRGEDTVARLGGDEFAIIQIGTSQPVGATALATRLIEAIGAPFQINGHQIIVGASVGISIAPEDSENAGQLLKNADLALYRAKSDGRGTYRFFEPAMDALMHTRRQQEIDLREAVGKGAFELHYQPIVDVESNKITGLEALLRWNHPVRGQIAPADFIPLAEETGLIAAIGEWVLRTACAQVASMPRPVKVAVNLSALQFAQGDLVQLVVQTLAATGLDAGRLELEVTESLLLENTDKVLSTLARLRALGVRIAMDDFGTGYSSLSSLRSFPFDKIKIDKSFAQGLGASDHAFAIIEAVAGIAARLEIATTAEGVETEDQLAWVRALGVTEVQGFFTGRPLPFAETIALLAADSGKQAAA